MASSSTQLVPWAIGSGDLYSDVPPREDSHIDPRVFGLARKTQVEALAAVRPVPPQKCDGTVNVPPPAPRAGAGCHF